MIGELISGIVIGPNVPGWAQPDDDIHILAEIGVILLLFQIGLETDVGKLLGAPGKAVVVAIAGFIVLSIFGFAVANCLFGLTFLIFTFIGGTLTVTSSGITVRTLVDAKRQNSVEG